MNYSPEWTSPEERREHLKRQLLKAPRKPRLLDNKQKPFDRPVNPLMKPGVSPNTKLYTPESYEDIKKSGSSRECLRGLVKRAEDNVLSDLGFSWAKKKPHKVFRLPPIDGSADVSPVPKRLRDLGYRRLPIIKGRKVRDALGNIRQVLPNLIQKVRAPVVTKKPQWTPNHEKIYRTLLGEAASEGVGGMGLVADTLVNRSRKSGESPWFEALKPWQYSMWNPRIENSGFMPAVPGAPERIRSAASNLAYRVLGGNYSPETDYTHYFNPDAVKKIPDWSLGQRGTPIGNHTFYSDIAPY